ncbi:uncharacterized protein LOC133195014 [Saccostrea echinata]|uniref:uncharacterized protein LOC133195014 n=1 Tax=Saccostrea echinata TaxID=191078 RepID=UPI002A7EDB26|nr:uncharacterized protein LOC133195014 [Saccostrea echinata]
MDAQKFNAQCKVRQCYQCQGDIEFYCNTCNHGLCLFCKERHVSNLDTITHDVVIYREKYENITKQENCVRHSGSVLENFCRKCKLPACFKCTEHRNHRKLDIRTAYKTNRQKEIIQAIRNESFFHSCFLAAIKTNIKTCNKDISNFQSMISRKGQKLKEELSKSGRVNMVHKLKQQRRNMTRHLIIIEQFEHRLEQSAFRAVTFLLLRNKKHVPTIKNAPKLTYYAPLLTMNEKVNKEDLTNVLNDFNVIKKKQIQEGKLSPTPMLCSFVKVKGVDFVIHISSVSSNRIWVSDYNNLVLTNTAGEKLNHLRGICAGFGVHTVNINGDLIYIDEYHNIRKLSEDNRKISTLIKETKPWMPLCVYCSPSNGDLLVGMQNSDTKKGKVTRYNDTGELIQTIQQKIRGKELYNEPRYITENQNGDIIVSDWYNDVVVTECGGRYRFSYSGYQQGLFPFAICTDPLSNILVCDLNSNKVQMIDKDGNFLSQILTNHQLQDKPRALSYDSKNTFLWVGFLKKRVSVYRYIERRDCLTGN